MELLAKYTLFAEGCRGHLGKQVEAKFALRADSDPQTYAIGIKELWEVDPEHFEKGLVMHTFGWPMEVRHLRRRLHLPLRREPGLGRPWSPLATRTRISRPSRKCSAEDPPADRPPVQGRQALAYGARAPAAGGLQSLPKLDFPGGALIGDDAGMLVASRIKGSHAAIKSGMLAAEAAAAALAAGRANDD
jgi:electron-transferring-flavoprotein dehydrogenase